MYGVTVPTSLQSFPSEKSSMYSNQQEKEEEKEKQQHQLLEMKLLQEQQSLINNESSFITQVQDFDRIMTSNVGSVAPSRNSIVAFMNNPMGLLDIGNPVDLFDDDLNIDFAHAGDRKPTNVPQGSRKTFNMGLPFQQQSQKTNATEGFPGKKSQLGFSYDNLTDSNSKPSFFDQHALDEISKNFTSSYRSTNQNNEPNEHLNATLSSSQRLQLSNLKSQFLQSNHHQQKSLIPKTQLPPSRSILDVFSIPDPFSAPINDDLFNDVPPPSINSKVNDKKRKGPGEAVMLSSRPKSPLTSAQPQTHQKLQQQKQQQSSLLHQACYLYPSTLAVVSSALTIDRRNVRRRIPTPQTVHNNNYNTSTNDTEYKKKRQKTHPVFTLPLHIALNQDASLDVVRILVDAAPDVIAMTDGPDASNAISTLLYKTKRKQQNTNNNNNNNNNNIHLELLQTLIMANPDAIQVVDRFQNTSLHVACAQGASLEMVQRLYTTYPEALQKENFHGQKPLDVAQRFATICPLSVIDYLQELVSAPLERSATHLDDSCNDDDDSL